LNVENYEPEVGILKRVRIWTSYPDSKAL